MSNIDDSINRVLGMTPNEVRDTINDARLRKLEPRRKYPLSAAAKARRNSSRKASRLAAGCKTGFVKNISGRCVTKCKRTPKGRCSKALPKRYYKLLGVKKGSHKATVTSAYNKLYQLSKSRGNSKMHKSDRTTLRNVYKILSKEKRLKYPFYKVKSTTKRLFGKPSRKSGSKTRKSKTSIYTVLNNDGSVLAQVPIKVPIISVRKSPRAKAPPLRLIAQI